MHLSESSADALAESVSLGLQNPFEWFMLAVAVSCDGWHGNVVTSAFHSGFVLLLPFDRENSDAEFIPALAGVYCVQ